VTEVPGFAQHRAEELRCLMAAAVPHRERRGSTEFCSLVTATEPEEMAWSCVRGGAGGGWLHQRVEDKEQAPQGSGHSPKLSECK